MMDVVISHADISLFEFCVCFPRDVLCDVEVSFVVNLQASASSP